MTGPAPDPRLPPRLVRTWALLASGRSDIAISRELFVTKKTVQKYVAQIYRELGLPIGGRQVNNRVAAALAFWGF